MNWFILLAKQAKVIYQPNMLINVWQRWNLAIKIDKMKYTQKQNYLQQGKQSSQK